MKADTADALAEEKRKPAAPTANERIWREVVSWFWVIVAFLLIEGTLVQARVIPSGSMENTVLIGDHLIVSRFGYDAGVPFTDWHVPLWRNPQRQQIIVFRAPLPEEGYPDFIKRCIGLPGDSPHQSQRRRQGHRQRSAALNEALRSSRVRRRHIHRRKLPAEQYYTARFRRDAGVGGGFFKIRTSSTGNSSCPPANIS